MVSIFETPTTTINFSDIEKLLIALGCDFVEVRGSRISFELNGQKLFMHRPHPAKEAKKYHVEADREFLELAGIKDEQHDNL